MARIKTTDYQNFVAYYTPAQKVKGGVYLTVMLDETDKTYINGNGKKCHVSQAAISRGEVRYDKQPEIETKLDPKGKHTTYYSDSQYKQMEHASKGVVGGDAANPKNRYEQDMTSGRLCLQFRAKVLYNKSKSPIIDTRHPILPSTNERYSAAYACNRSVQFAQAQNKYDEQVRQQSMNRRLGQVAVEASEPVTDYSDDTVLPYE